MDFDYTSTIGLQLDLGLALHDQYLHKDCDGHRKKESKKKKMENSSKCNMAYPSLTLRPLDDDENVNNQDEASKIESCDQNLHTQVTSPSIECSFSNSTSIKREIGEEFDVEIEKVPTNMGDHVDENGNPRKKLRLTKEQSTVLKENFRKHSTLNPRQKQTLAKELNLSDRQVEVWFQNQRARKKLKQTESDCELLKKCCESLTEENKKLQKEVVQELEAMQTVAAPFYMQIIPAVTLTICPSCEIICGGNNTNNGSSPTTTTLLIDSKSHNPFYNQNNNNKIYPSPHPSS